MPAAVIVTMAAGFVLGHLARWFADGLSVNLQLFFHAFRPSDVSNPWVRAPVHFLSAGVIQYSALACWGIGWGFVMSKAGAGQRGRLQLLFASSVLLGIIFTDTSVRGTQPQFFAEVYWWALSPLAAGAVCVVTAWMSARAARRGAWGPETAVLLGLAAFALGWWSITDVSHAIAYGCVPVAGVAELVCPPRHYLSGVAVVGLLSVPVIDMVWDIIRRKRGRVGGDMPPT